MSKNLGERLPYKIQEAFNGRDLGEKLGLAYLVITSDPDGTPHPAMLSMGEILALDDRRLRLALWQGTRTGANLERGSPFVLCFVGEEDAVFYVKGSPKALPTEGRARGFQCFECQVDSVESDAHKGLPVTHGLRFHCPDDERPRVLDLWERTMQALRQA
ncbi:MAG: pyridoxamine 5'-phosphate oxidase family protein [Chloroflexi bacterium]|nr:pyridoxamine 5'-phosphate oxidase family protein [Chloroflexota bacterium]